MHLARYQALIDGVPYGKRLPGALYIARPAPDALDPALLDMIRRAEVAADPASDWNLLKLHTDQVAFTFLSYPEFDSDPHPALAEATKINLNTGNVVRTDYRRRANPPILHRKETFLPPADPRVEAYAALTREEEALGLYRHPSKIGLRIQWMTLLKRVGVTYAGHALRRIERAASDSAAPGEQGPGAAVHRHRTAIKRYDLSRPMKILLESGLLRKGDTLFDFGCGHGMDIEALRHLGYEAEGWDPAFRPGTPKRASAVVNLGYVLNVIEEPAERVATLREAYALTGRLLLVSTMVTGQETDAHTRPYRDGFLTKTNTFQKFYAPGELESLIEETLGAEAITLGLGVCAAFRDPEEAELFQAARNRRRIDWSDVSAQLKFSAPAARSRASVGRYELHRELLDAFWGALLDLGRAPESGEFDRLADVRRVAGGINRAVALVVARHGDDLYQLARKARTEDALVYLAMTNFRRRFLRREIPPRLRNDIRAFFGDLPTGQAKAREVLFAAGDPGEIELAIEGLDFGRYDPEARQFTFHRSMLDRLPPILRVYVGCAAIRYGDPAEADLIKIHVLSRKLTFLHYDDFERDPLPALRTRIKINLRTRFVEVFDHSATDDPQLLPFKELYLPRDHPAQRSMMREAKRLHALALTPESARYGITRNTLRTLAARNGMKAPV